MKRFPFLGCTLVLCALGLVACGGDDSDGTTPAQGDSGTDSSGSANDASLAGDAGHDAAVPPGHDAASDAGPDADAGLDGTVGPDASTRDGGLESGPVEAGAARYALFVGTDFSNAELSVVALHPDSVAGRLPLADQDSVPYTSAGFGFLLERAVGKVAILDHAQPWTVKTTVDVNDTPDAGQYASNPRTVLVTTGTKAYVARYSSNVVKVIDVSTGAVTGSVDFSGFMSADDTDGVVEVQDAFYDASTQRAYFLLQRINQFDYSGSAPDYVAACLPSRGQIVAIDVTTDAIVDLNGDAGAGSAIDLIGDNPGSLTYDAANGRFIVTESGCYQNVAGDAGPDSGVVLRRGRGIEAVSLATASSAWLYQTTDVARLSGLVWVDATQAFVNKGQDWFPWNPTHTNLGAAIAEFPQAPVYDGTGRVVGLSYGTAPDAGADAGSVWSVVAFDVATSTLSTIAAAPFHSVVPVSGYSALLP